jgi:hypothetical protein
MGTGDGEEGDGQKEIKRDIYVQGGVLQGRGGRREALVQKE